MIPIKDKKYLINCQGPYDYNCYMGDGVFTGEVVDFEGETCYGFIIPTEKEVCFFVEGEIVGEIASDGKIKTESVQEQIDSENHYCETCGSCGEDGCCTPAKCEEVKCKYGESCVEDYERMRKQWDIMFKALESISNNYEICDEVGLMLRAKHALDEIEESW